MKKTFWGNLWDSFNAVSGPLLSFLSFILTAGLSVILWIIPNTAKIEVSIFAIIIVIIIIFALFWLLIVTLWHSARKNFEEVNTITDENERIKKENLEIKEKLKHRLTPKILSVIQKPKGSEFILLLEKSDLLAIGGFISFYYIWHDEFEACIGIGEVNNIQSNGLIQAKILKREDEYQDIWQKVENQNTEEIAKILVKPGITKNWVQLI